MKTKIVHLFQLLALMAISMTATAQNDFLSHFTKLKLEARADAQYFNYSTSSADEFGFQGRYFNLMVGGNITDQVSYYFRQRIVANSGSVNLFDNTDFLYVNYAPTDNWFFRLGKDAMAVGGFEYDAAPIDVLYSTMYWDNYYCFQLGAAAGFKTNDGNHTFMAQVTNSPYVFTGGNPWSSGLMAYNLFWNGSLGDHYKALWSVNALQYNDNNFIGYIALGNMVTYNDFDIYVDLIHHNLSSNDWGKNFGIVSRANWHINKEWTLFAKGAYEQNRSEQDLYNFNNGLSSIDCFVKGGHTYCRYGGGVEYRPSFCPSLRLHAYIVNVEEGVDARYINDIKVSDSYTDSYINANIGVTWDLFDLKK